MLSECIYTSGGGGSGYTKTLIWTNQSPNATFGSQPITLDNNEEWSNYDMLGITFKAYTGYKTLCSVYVDVTNTLTTRAASVHSGDSSTAYGITGAVYAWWSGGADYARGFRLADDETDGTKKIRFFACYRMASSSTGFDNYLIPYKIYGFKFNDEEWKLQRIADL